MTEVAVLAGLLLLLIQAQPVSVKAETVAFQNQGLSLRGVVYKPEGPGPFPALLYNHGSAPGMASQQAFERLGPLFAKRGWVFFAPWRRGQGLSAEAGPYIGNTIAAARDRAMWRALLIAIPVSGLLFFLVARKWEGGVRIGLGALSVAAVAIAVYLPTTRAGAREMVRTLESEHLSDQLAGFAWLHGQAYVDTARIATAGNSFGGIQAVLGAERVKYCAAVSASGGAEGWRAPEVRAMMVRAARGSQAPIFFFQAENDYDIAPSRTLSSAMREAGKVAVVKIYPKFGRSRSEGHSFAWAGSETWAGDVFAFLEAHCSPVRSP